MNKTHNIFLAGMLLAITACSKKNDSDNNSTGGGTTTTTVEVTTVAGTGVPGTLNGAAGQAQFDNPTGISISSSGYIFIADRQNQLVREISPGDVVANVEGTAGVQGYKNTADSVEFKNPNGVAVDAAGTIFVADEGNGYIRAISNTGVTITFAGSVAGALIKTAFLSPAGVAVDAAGDVFVGDVGKNTVTKITAKGIVTIVAGTGSQGFVNGSGTAASFNQPTALVTDGEGNIYVADYGNNVIRLINNQGQVSTFAGSGTAGNTNGKGTAASFNGPSGIAIDSQGNLYVADSKNNTIREISINGAVTTLAGTGAAGATNGALTAATFNNPEGVAVDSEGNVYVADTGNNVIRKIAQ
jgi:sugar lactone lactonase YvrE